MRGKKKMTNVNLAKMIDHTILKPDATAEQIITCCEEAIKYQFASVCVSPFYVPIVAQILHGTTIKVCTVIGFPLGATTTNTKVFETQEAIKNGATEVDMVLNISALKSGNWEFVQQDIQAVVDSTIRKASVKVILETCLLTTKEKETACHISKNAGADFVKTSTGFSIKGATVEDIILMRRVVGPNMGVKASGGIKDVKTAMEMIKAGANRIGTSSGITIINNV